MNRIDGFIFYRPIPVGSRMHARIQQKTLYQHAEAKETERLIKSFIARVNEIEIATE